MSHYVISKLFVVPLEYGDFTGLDDAEEKTFRAWCDRHIPANAIFDWKWLGIENLTTCEITRKFGDCAELTVRAAK